MRELGICKKTGRVYEGSSGSGIPVEGRSNLFPITFHELNIDAPTHSVDGFPPLLFREDSFDSITKIRRGRVVKLSTETQPKVWRVHDQIRKDLKLVSWASGAAQETELFTYQRSPLNELKGLSKFPNVIIGEAPHHSIWSLLSIEKQYDGALLLTLKAVRSLGVVPDVNFNKYSAPARKELKRALEQVEVSANKLSPKDTVDRCRDALSIVFGDLANNLTVDLGQGISKYLERNKVKDSKRDGQDLISKNADIVRVLHARGKPNESHKHSTRPIDEEDANLALNCLWFVLTELDAR
ncbi:hypothetical protein [Alteromonas macleodii]|uniref:hypothetical protein n=1 Tax=Alteromonas macleodii TaxID=28108 RepID=UPI00066BA80E|nr:hypothetical protein [Alteromonas macleodii]CAI3966807.1 hypothetical protein MIT1002_03392 [Alteromonas macleodii]VTP55289.1 hypothetical protein MIT1002_03392 [Alteromonas macleodii]